jgi:hypothetical protein
LPIRCDCRRSFYLERCGKNRFSSMRSRCVIFDGESDNFTHRCEACPWIDKAAHNPELSNWRIEVLIRVSIHARRMSELMAKYSGKVIVILEAADMGDVGKSLP